VNSLLFNHILGFALNCVVLAIIAVLVLRSHPANILHRAFSANQFAISWWSFFTILMIIAPSDRYGLFWDRMCLSGVVFIPATLAHYIASYTKDDRRLKGRICFNYVLSVFFLLCVWFTRLVVLTVRPKFGMNFFTVPGPLYAVFVGFFISNVLLGLILLWRNFQNASDAKIKRQSQLLFWFSAVGYSGGVCNYLLVYDFELPGVAETSNYGVLILSISLAHIIFRHKFLDIEVIIKRTLVFAGLLAVVMGVVAVVSSLVNGVVARWFSVPPTAVAIGSSLIVVVVFDPARKLLLNLTDKFLFQKSLDFKIALNRLSQNIVSILEIDKIAKTILKTLEQTLRLEAVTLLIKSPDEKSYRILDAYGVNDLQLELPSEDLFVQYLAERSELINLQNEEQKKDLPLEFSNTMARLNARLAIPLRVEHDLVGILLWGKKKSDQDFTQEELGYLPTVAAQVAIAFSYARAIDILKKSQIDFAQQSKLAALGTLSAGISHEIKNPMNQIGMAIGMLKFKEKNHLYDQAPPEEFKKEVFESLERVEHDAKRVNDIVERLSAFAKKPKEVKLEDVKVEEVVAGMLAIIETEFRNHQIEVIKNYDPDLPVIRADYHAVEEVMLNLLVNAQHAIKEKGAGHGTITISIKKSEGGLEIGVKDSGVGIPAENFEKIFDPFFTTKDVSRNPDPNAIKGTGLGLHLIREIVKRYGGKIAVESVIGEGTLFRVFFPVGHDEDL